MWAEGSPSIPFLSHHLLLILPEVFYANSSKRARAQTHTHTHTHTHSLFLCLPFVLKGYKWKHTRHLALFLAFFSYCLGGHFFAVHRQPLLP